MNDLDEKGIKLAMKLCKTITNTDIEITIIERGFLLGVLAFYLGVNLMDGIQEMKKQ